MVFIQMVSGRVRFRKIDFLGGENGKEEGLLAGLPTVETSLVFKKKETTALKGMIA